MQICCSKFVWQSMSVIVSIISKCNYCEHHSDFCVVQATRFRYLIEHSDNKYSVCDINGLYVYVFTHQFNKNCQLNRKSVLDTQLTAHTSQTAQWFFLFFYFLFNSFWCGHRHKFIDSRILIVHNALCTFLL